ncbi:MAG: hypothetical protein QG673_280 [Pseudomonadota bacterium]|nr:hypothetical protein [Pseudomonadota bacterium]
MKKNIRFSQFIILSTAATTFLLSSSSNAATTTKNTKNYSSANPSSAKLSLSAYQKTLRHYSKNASSNQVQSTLGYQQTFSLDVATQLQSVNIEWYSDNSCNTSIPNPVVLGGGPTTFQAGTWTSTDGSNYAVCTLYNNTNTGQSGCSGMQVDALAGNLQSVRYTYNYAMDGGTHPEASYCMSNVGLGYEALLDYSNGGAAACTSGSSCGYSQAYATFPLPAVGPGIIFLTAATFTGNLGGFAGANALCEADTAKPAAYATARFKALLATNEATHANVQYYSLFSSGAAVAPPGDYITTATDGNLVGFSGNLDSAISPNPPTPDYLAWTGFTPNMTSSYDGWSGGGATNGGAANACSSGGNPWTSTSGSNTGMTGISSVTDGASSTADPTLAWDTANYYTCDNSTTAHLYCVSQ